MVYWAFLLIFLGRCILHPSNIVPWHNAHNIQIFSLYKLWPIVLYKKFVCVTLSMFLLSSQMLESHWITLSLLRRATMPRSSFLILNAVMQDYFSPCWVRFCSFLDSTTLGLPIMLIRDIKVSPSPIYLKSRDVWKLKYCILYIHISIVVTLLFSVS